MTTVVDRAISEIYHYDSSETVAQAAFNAYAQGVEAYRPGETLELTESYIGQTNWTKGDLLIRMTRKLAALAVQKDPAIFN